MKEVLVIGGGFAGLSAAVELADHGVGVTVIERRRILGGRAYSVEDSATGELIDNGQHALLGAFHETRRFLKRLGTDGKVKFQDRFRLVLAEPGGGRITLDCPALPPPLHLAAGVLLGVGLSMADRFHLLRAGLAISLSSSVAADLTVSKWMDSLHQPESLRRRWWYPLSVSATNEQPARASADLFLRVLKRAFYGTPRDSSFGIMTVGLGELYTEQSRRFIESHGGEVRLNTAASRLVFAGRRLDGVELRNGERVRPALVISAVPHDALARMLPEILLGPGSPFEGLAHLGLSPMVSIHLWFERPVIEEEFIGLVDSPIQWVFNKSRLWLKGGAQTGALACITSGAYDLIDRPREELVALAEKELGRYFPEARKARLVHSRLIKERGATYSCTPEAERWRPEPRTSYENFFLAGDWTRTGLPATIEGAVGSGRRCAEMTLRALKKNPSPASPHTA